MRKFKFKTHKTLTIKLVKDGRFILTQFTEQSRVYILRIQKHGGIALNLFFVSPCLCILEFQNALPYNSRILIFRNATRSP